MVAPSRIVTLTTDFGTDDTFVGEMKGAILAVDASLRIVDLTHAVPPHDTVAGACLLDIGTRAFPAGTVHVAVVDPGVGTERRALAIETDDAYWVGPDNGVLARALRGRRIARAHALEGPPGRPETVATTFDGRERFAPFAARIATGEDLTRFGPEVTDLDVPAPPPAPVPGGPPIEVDVVHVDRFGNVYLDLARSAIGPGARIEVDPGVGGAVDRVLRAYADSVDRRPFLIWNAAGLLELAVREGRVADVLGLRRGDTVAVRVVGPPEGAPGTVV